MTHSQTRFQFRTNASPKARWLLGTLLVLAVCPATPASARTITLSDIDCELIASISSVAPRSGWAGFLPGSGEFSNYYVELYHTGAFLIRYPLDRIPPGQKIVKAEWVLPSVYVYPAIEQRLAVRRLLTDWGPGVCHDFRTTRPARVPWSQPGARGAGSDRAAKPTAVMLLSTAADRVVDVTQDVELWYGGGVKNYGWIVNLEGPGALIRLGSPLYSGRGLWKLRITYEPE